MGLRNVATRVHPVIRIISLIILATFVSLGGGWVVLITTILLASVYLIIDSNYFHSAWRMLRRLRWFFLSIFILYTWFMPGNPSAEAASFGWARLIPSAEGVLFGLIRVGALVVIVLAVNLLLQSTSRELLFRSIYWLARPAGWCGLSRERLAIRITLVMATLEDAQTLLEERKLRQSTRSITEKRHQLGIIAGDLLATVISRAEESPLHTITIDMGTPPPYYQWLYPASISLVLWLLSSLN